MRPVSILMYHSVGERRNPAYDRWCVTPERFAEQMAVLADRGYTVLATGDYIRRRLSRQALPERFVVVTFDDGLQDFLTGAFPVLRHFGFPATLYVVAGLVGQSGQWLAPLGEGTRPMLTAEELRFLSRSGIEIGGHTLSHPQLDLLDPDSARREIEGCRQALEIMIGVPVTSFAYPHGYNSGMTRRIVEEAGYRSAVRVRDAQSELGECVYGLSRLVVTEDLDRDAFVALLERSDRPVAPPQDRLAGTLWRLARRWQGRGGRNPAFH